MNCTPLQLKRNPEIFVDEEKCPIPRPRGPAVSKISALNFHSISIIYIGGVSIGNILTSYLLSIKSPFFYKISIFVAIADCSKGVRTWIF